jgi:hypothetical protein
LYDEIHCMMKDERWKIYDQDLLYVGDKIYDQDLLYVDDNIHDQDLLYDERRKIKIYCVLMIRFIVCWW